MKNLVNIFIVAVLFVAAVGCSFVVQDTRTPEEKFAAESTKAAQTVEANLVPTITPPPITIEPNVLPDACIVKGNVSSSGEKIYHVEGQANYSRVIIDPDHGEKCFDTEDEAVAEGWRKSLR